MKKYLYLLILTIFLIIPQKAYASCTSSEKTRLQTFASNITYKYDYKETFDKNSYGSISFNIYLYNVTDEMVVKYAPNYTSTGEVVTKGKIDLNKINGVTTLQNVAAGKSHRFEVYASGSTCNNERLYTFYVSTPSYNKYYSSELCKKAPDHSYCNRWANLSITEEQFTKELTNYINNEDKKEEPKEEEKKNPSFKDKVIEYLIIANDYVYYVTIPVIVISLLLIIVLNKRKKDKMKF